MAHVDRDRSNADADNLAWLCLDHHGRYDSRSRMTKSVTPGELRLYREKLHLAVAAGGLFRLAPADATAIAAAAAPAFITNASGGGNNVVNSAGGTVNMRVGRGAGPATIVPPAGTIGHDADRRSYCDYLVKRYNEWAQKRRNPRTADRRFAHAVIRKNVESRFGSPMPLIPVERFGDLVVYLQGRIDATLFGKNGGHRNYHTFEKHRAKRRGG